jgi:hypothetical protein
MVASAERVAAQVRWYTPGPQPNGLQAVDEGVWVIDQKDLDVYLLDWADGRILKRFPTATNHSSGITFDGEHLWVASTFPPIELFQYSVDGQELRRLPTPGASERRGRTAWSGSRASCGSPSPPPPPPTSSTRRTDGC